MNRTGFDRIEPAEPAQAFPIRLSQRWSPTSTLVMAALTVPLALGCLFVPLYLAIAGAFQAEPLSRLTSDPVYGLTLVTALALATYLAVMALSSLFGRVGRSRILEIRAGHIEVQDRSLFGQRSWQSPVASFTGIAHHMRATLSGTRHEIVLVSPDPNRSLLLFAGERVSQDTMQRYARLLDLPVVPAKILYPAFRPWGRMRSLGALATRS
ncbi:MAG: hypothetical protein AB7E70_05085 [Hyphomicrobiaceae bacterium]